MSDAPLQSLVNGQQAEHISIRDRGFQYGDGCFETIRVLANKPILWSAHLERLRKACKTLQLSVDFNQLEKEATRLLQTNLATDVILKITITRGEGGRGYGPAEGANCTRVLQLLDYSPPDKSSDACVILCQHRLSSGTGLAGIKHLNRLDQVLASAQIPTDCDEGLCLDEGDAIIEGCRSNVLLVVEDQLLTPDLGKCGVEGVMLNHLIAAFDKQGTPVLKERISLARLLGAQQILLCNSVFGVWPIARIKHESWQAASEQHAYTAAALQIQNTVFRN